MSRNKTFFKEVKSHSNGFNKYVPEDIPGYKHINNSSRWNAKNALDDTAEWAKIYWTELIVCKFRPGYNRRENRNPSGSRSSPKCVSADGAR